MYYDVHVWDHVQAQETLKVMCFCVCHCKPWLLSGAWEYPYTLSYQIYCIYSYMHPSAGCTILFSRGFTCAGSLCIVFLSRCVHSYIQHTPLMHQRVLELLHVIHLLTCQWCACSSSIDIVSKHLVFLYILCVRLSMAHIV